VRLIFPFTFFNGGRGMDDIELLDGLLAVYRDLSGWYGELRELSEKILGRLVLSRGDLSGIVPMLKHKQELLAAIERRRGETAGLETLWQERKQLITDRRAARFNLLLEETSAQMKRFIDTEEQVKRRLEHIMNRESAGDNGK